MLKNDGRSAAFRVGRVAACSPMLLNYRRDIPGADRGSFDIVSFPGGGWEQGAGRFGTESSRNFSPTRTSP